MENWKKNLVATFLTCMVLMVSACKQDLTPITREIRAVGGRITAVESAANNAQTTANNAERVAAAAQTTANNANSAITGDGGVNAQIEDLSWRLERLEACNPNSAGFNEADCDDDHTNNRDDLCVRVPAGEHPDPTRAGCPDGDRDNDGVLDHDDQCPELPETTPDAGVSDSDGGADSDAATNPHTGCPIGHEPTVVVDAGADSDAAVTANTDPDAATPEVPTEIVQHDPAAPTAPVAAPTPAATSNIPTVTSGTGVCTFIQNAQNGGTAAAVRFNRITAADVRDMLAHAADAPCAANQPTGCWRLARSGLTLQNCNPASPTAACVLANGEINGCSDPSGSVIVRRCPTNVVGCTAETAGNAFLTPPAATPARRHARRRSRDGYAGFGWNGFGIGISLNN